MRILSTQWYLESSGRGASGHAWDGRGSLVGSPALTGILVCVSGERGHDTVGVEHSWWLLAQKCFKLSFLYILRNWESP